MDQCHTKDETFNSDKDRQEIASSIELIGLKKIGSKSNHLGEILNLRKENLNLRMKNRRFSKSNLNSCTKIVVSY